MKRCVTIFCLLFFLVTLLAVPVYASAGETPSVEPEASESVDPEGEESEEPELAPEFIQFGKIISFVWSLFQQKFTIWGFTLSWGGLLLFEMASGIVIYLLWRFT